MKKLKFINTLLITPIVLTGISLCNVSCSSNNDTYINPNPHESIKDDDPEIIKSLQSIKRMDKDGYLYFMENSIDYYNDQWLNGVVWTAEQALKGWTDASIIEFIDACSAFCAKDLDGKMMTSRVYDFPHSYTDTETGKSVYTGLNVMIHTPKNENKGVKYESIGTTDAYLVLSKLLSGIKHGSLDDGKTDISLAAILPLITTDGINEKGLTASILLLPLDNQFSAKTESEAKTITRPETITKEISIARVVRYVIDSCETVDEVTTLLSNTWFNRILKSNFHLFVTDNNGQSRLYEWNMVNEDATEQYMTVTNTNAATNFYQTFSDVDNVPKVTGLKNSYHYGYARPGNATYDRFNAIVSMLDFYTTVEPAVGEISQASIRESIMEDLLKMLTIYPTSTNPYNLTQFSCFFKSNDLTQKIYSYGDLTKSWTYSLKEHKFI